MDEGDIEMSEEIISKIYGVWNSIKKEFQFGIKESSPSKARKALFDRIGKDSYKWRFEIQEIKEHGYAE